MDVLTLVKKTGDTEDIHIPVIGESVLRGRTKIKRLSHNTIEIILEEISNDCLDTAMKANNEQIRCYDMRREDIEHLKNDVNKLLDVLKNSDEMVKEVCVEIHSLQRMIKKHEDEIRKYNDKTIEWNMTTVTKTTKINKSNKGCYHGDEFFTDTNFFIWGEIENLPKLTRTNRQKINEQIGSCLLDMGASRIIKNKVWEAFSFATWGKVNGIDGLISLSERVIRHMDMNTEKDTIYTTTSGLDCSYYRVSMIGDDTAIALSLHEISLIKFRYDTRTYDVINKRVLNGIVEVETDRQYAYVLYADGLMIINSIGDIVSDYTSDEFLEISNICTLLTPKRTLLFTVSKDICTVRGVSPGGELSVVKKFVCNSRCIQSFGSDTRIIIRNEHNKVRYVICDDTDIVPVFIHGEYITQCSSNEIPIPTGDYVKFI